MEEAGLRTQRNEGSRCSEWFIGSLLKNGEETLLFGVGSETVSVLGGQDLSFADKLQLGVFYKLEFNLGGSRIIKITALNGTLIWAA
jgi:hypothetical protein